ncbi:MAG: hypothetical protein Ct9H300mP28_26980 [Pseudomonadota bacterium]|nr:MAG: hypothetical protein Ct9H300mP28_26980 [Pseudomonadota bacterium]
MHVVYLKMVHGTFIEDSTKRLSNEVGNSKVLMFLSGGVDSSVAFALLNKALER